MKKALNRSLSLLLAITIIFGSAYVGLSEIDFEGLFAVKAKAASSGTCGDNLTWTLDNEGILTISGTGDMKNYTFSSPSLSAPWYSYTSSIKTIVVKSGVTSIGSRAFWECASLTSVIIGGSVTRIGDYAFYNCSNLTSITIPDSVISICNGAFYNCSSLTSVTIPDSIVSIGNSAFYNCSSLTSVTIPGGVSFIDNKAFYGCISLTSVTFGNGVRNTGDYVFENCSSLTSVTIPDSVISIGNYAFSGCSLTSVTIPDSVTSIGNGAFYNCSSLTSLTIPDSVTSIGGYAFYGCKSLTSVTIPDSVTSMGSFVFFGCAGLTSVTIPDSVTSIGTSAFSGCSSLTSVTIPDGVTSIGMRAFSGCSLTSITIPNNVTSIDYAAFSECTSLTFITIPDSVTSIGTSAFSGCTSLTDVYYGGTEADWAAISIGSNNGALTGTTIHYRYNCHATGHTVVKDPAVAATCTAAGRTEGSHCSVCNAVINAQTVVPATGHTTSGWIVDITASYTNLGSKHTECNVCGETLQTAVIPQLAPLTPALKATNTLNGIQISWDVVAGATKYVVYRRNAGSSTWTAIGTVTSTSLVDKNVTAGKYYIYSVRAYNSEGAYSAYVSTKTKTIQYILTPTAVATNLTNGVQVKWNSVTGATKYNVYRRVGGSSSWVLVGTTTGTSLVDKNITNGKYYVYSIRAINSTGYSAFDTTKTDTIQPITAPTAKVAKKSNGVQVSWNSVSGATKYNVYRRLGGTSTWIYVGTTTSTTLLDKGVVKGKSYAYSIRAINGTGYSAYNSTKCAAIKYS